MATTYLTKTLPQNHGAVYKWTYSFWVKRSGLGAYQCILGARLDGNYNGQIRFDTDDRLEVHDYRTSYLLQKVTNRKFRDTSAWYHIVVANDNSVSSPDLKIYVNGVQETSFSTDNEYSQNETNSFNNIYPNYIGQKGNGHYFDGSLSHFHFIDGTAYTASTFGSTDSTTGEWKINTSPTVTYGDNGFFILKDGNSLTDQSPNTNNFTLGGGTLTKTEDNPSNNFATINTLLGADVIGSTVEFSSGNTLASDPNGQASGINPNFISSLGMPSKGKWYCEVQPASFSTGSGHSIGIYRTKGSTDDTGEGDLELNSSKVRYIFADTSHYIIKYGTNDQTGLSGVSSGETVGIALDLDNGTLQYYVNGSARANQLTGINSANDGFDYFFHAGLESSSSGRYGIYKFNFGNGAFGSTQLTGTTYNDSQGRGIFKYQPPTNFLALCTKNLNV